MAKPRRPFNSSNLLVHIRIQQTPPPLAISLPDDAHRCVHHDLKYFLWFTSCLEPKQLDSRDMSTSASSTRVEAMGPIAPWIP